MKKNNFLLLLAGLLFVVSCNQREKPIKPIEKKSEVSFEDLSIGIYTDSLKAREYIERFKDKYKPDKKTPKDSITRSVWFSREVFKYIDSMITQVDPNISGVRIHFGSYDRHGRAPGQASPNQISLFFIATRDDSNGYHVNDWNFFKKPPEPKDIINHGELCPHNCEGAN